MALKFGTDGIRGAANKELTVELSLALGRAAVRVFQAKEFYVARDTRISGPAIGAALAAGMASEGANVIDVGVLPTAGLAHLAADFQRPAAMISASHNPFQDNGIKLFTATGEKLSDETEELLEAELAAILENPGPGGAGDDGVGVVSRPTLERFGWDHFESRVRRAMENEDASGLRVVVDAANGAASDGVKQILERLGVKVTAIHSSPNGININDACGSTHPQSLQQAVVDTGADAGLALDGDADRVLAVDETGALVDGDQMMCVFAADMKQRGLLVQNSLVVTVMSNLGLRKACTEQGISIVTTAVGDRYVLEALNENGLSLGGEQSGHIVFPEHGTTGDGITTGVLLLSALKRSGKPMSKLVGGAMTRFPQVLVNVPVKDRSKLDGATAVWDEVRAVEAELQDSGRVLLRPSGTESLVRVMVEAQDIETAQQVCDRLCAVVAESL